MKNGIYYQVSRGKIKLLILPSPYIVFCHLLCCKTKQKKKIVLKGYFANFKHLSVFTGLGENCCLCENKI